MSNTQVDTNPHLNARQWQELHRVQEGAGRYWPSGREVVTLRALSKQGFVVFQVGYGWALQPAGSTALSEYVQENPHAFT